MAGGLKLGLSRPIHLDVVAADFPEPPDRDGAPGVALAGRTARGRAAQAQHVDRSVGLVTAPVLARPGAQHQGPVAGPGAVRYRLPVPHPRAVVRCVGNARAFPSAITEKVLLRNAQRLLGLVA